VQERFSADGFAIVFKHHFSAVLAISFFIKWIYVKMHKIQTHYWGKTPVYKWKKLK